MPSAPRRPRARPRAGRRARSRPSRSEAGAPPASAAAARRIPTARRCSASSAASSGESAAARSTCSARSGGRRSSASAASSSGVGRAPPAPSPVRSTEIPFAVGFRGLRPAGAHRALTLRTPARRGLFPGLAKSVSGGRGPVGIVADGGPGRVPGDAGSQEAELERQLDPRAIGDHIDRLHRAAWALCGSREDAEDLVQETFARVLAKPRLLRREDDLGYLLRAMRNVFLSQRRTESRRPRTSPLPEEAVFAERRPDADPAGLLRGARGLRRRRRPARRLPRRAGGGGRRGALLQGGGEGLQDARGHRHEPSLPRAPAGGPGAGRVAGRSAAGAGGAGRREWRSMHRMRRPRRGTAIALGAVVALGAAVAPAAANLIDRSSATGRLVLIGQDADSTADPVIQPPDAGAGVGDQSLRKSDQILGGSNDDIARRPPRPGRADRQRRRRRHRRRPGARGRHRRRRVPQLRFRLRRPGR